MKRPIIVAVICVLAAAVLLIWGFNSSVGGVSSASRRYVLIADSDTGTFFMQLRKGMQDAAHEANAEFVVLPAKEEAVLQVQALQAKGTSCVLLLLDKPQKWVSAATAIGLPAVVIGQRLEGQACIVTDDVAAGATLIARAKELAGLEMTDADMGADMQEGQVLVIRQERNERVKLLCDGMRLHTQQQGVAVRQSVVSSKEIDDYAVIIATDKALTAQLCALKASGLLPHSVVLGVDTGDRRVADLEGGYAEALLFENPYALGYMALTRAAKSAMAGKTDVFLCPTTLVDAKSMYAAENVKAVFPLLQ